MDLAHNKHEAFLTCLETMSNHLMTARTKHSAEHDMFSVVFMCKALLKQTSSILFLLGFVISL